MFYDDLLPSKWDEAIRCLGRDFCIPSTKVEGIINKVVICDTKDNYDRYQRAWRMLFDLI